MPIILRIGAIKGMLVGDRQRGLDVLLRKVRGDDPADGPVRNGLLSGGQRLIFFDDPGVIAAGV